MLMLENERSHPLYNCKLYRCACLMTYLGVTIKELLPHSPRETIKLETK